MCPHPPAKPCPALQETEDSEGEGDEDSADDSDDDLPGMLTPRQQSVWVLAMERLTAVFAIQYLTYPFDQVAVCMAVNSTDLPLAPRFDGWGGCFKALWGRGGWFSSDGLLRGMSLMFPRYYPEYPRPPPIA